MCTVPNFDGSTTANKNSCVATDSQWKEEARYFVSEGSSMKHQRPLQQQDKPNRDGQADITAIFSMDRLEPSPIKPHGIRQGYQKIDKLPDIITKYCDEYIAVLSKLGEDDTQPRNPTVGSSPELQAVHSNDGVRSSSLHEMLEATVDDCIHPYQNERWMERYYDLVEYFQIQGDLNIPFKQSPPLFQWVKRQRHQYKLKKQGQHSNLTADRIELLENIGFVWDSHGVAWDEKFQELKEFENIHCHCFVPCNYKGNSKLSTWIKRQRRQYRRYIAKQSSTMDEDRINKLEGLGFAWDYNAVKEMISDGEISRL
jgi:hypothetical protein